jgi:hypothetical protein
MKVRQDLFWQSKKNQEWWAGICKKRVSARLRNRIRTALNGNGKSASTEDLIGCSFDQLRDHLEKQFLPGMTWSNNTTNGWHVDHVRPCASFDLTDPVQQRQCFHYSNLRPMWAAENRSKGKKVDESSPLLSLTVIGRGGDFSNRRARAPFVVYRRSSGVVKDAFYAGFLDARTGSYQRRVLHRGDGSNVTERAEAERIALEISRACHEQCASNGDYHSPLQSSSTTSITL